MPTERAIQHVISERILKYGSPSSFIQVGAMFATSFDGFGLHNPGGFRLEEASCEESDCTDPEPHTHFLAIHDGRTRIEYEEDQYLIKKYGAHVVHPHVGGEKCEKCAAIVATEYEH